MSPLRGTPRKLSSIQIDRVLTWHAARRAIRERFGARRQLAQQLGVSVFAVSCVLAQAHGRSRLTPRVRHLTTLQRRKIRAWDRGRRLALAKLCSIEALAQELGVSVRTVQHCIRRAGGYKQGTLAEIQEEQRIERVRKSLQQPARTCNELSSMLRRWPRRVRESDAVYRVRRIVRQRRTGLPTGPGCHRVLAVQTLRSGRNPCSASRAAGTRASLDRLRARRQIAGGQSRPTEMMRNKQ